MRTTRHLTLIVDAPSAVVPTGHSAGSGSDAERSTDQQSKAASAGQESAAPDGAGPAAEGSAGPAPFTSADG